MNKINVVGTSGSGKSTFSRTLATKLVHPYIEMDAIFWKANWQESSDEEFFSDFLSRPYGEGRSMMEILAAGGCKIVKKVKGQYSRKGGFQIQSHMVKFMTPQDKAQYGKEM